MTTRLHQIIAVEKTVKKTEETAFTKAYHAIQKSEQFSGFTKTYQPKDEEGQQLPAESKKVLSNASELVIEVQAALQHLFDHVATKDNANRFAVADIKVGDQVLATDVPVSTLLWIEKKLIDIRSFVSKLPVLDPTENWTWDDKNAIYRTDAYETLRQRADTQYITVAPATDKHPAQVVPKKIEVFEGTWTTTKLSGAVSPQWQRKILLNVDQLTMAVKRARETANATEVTDVHIGNTLLNFVFSS